MRAAVTTLALWALCCVCARADQGVVLREAPGLRPGLCTALRIQLSGVAEVTCEREPETGGLSERLGAAATRVREADARLGVLLERDPDPGQVRMYVVSARTDQAVVAIERIEDRPEPDVDRSLALTVRDAYELVAAVKAAAPTAPAPLASVLAVPNAPSPPPDAPAPELDERALFTDAGGGVSLGAELGGAALLTLGIARTHGARTVEGALGVRLATTRDATRTVGRASIAERGPVVGARAVWTRGRFAYGAGALASLLVLSAEGTTADGSHGSEVRLGPQLSFGPELRLRLLAHAFLRLSPSLDVTLVKHRFTLDAQTIVTTERVRVTVPLSVVVALPFSGGGVQP